MAHAHLPGGHGPSVAHAPVAPAAPPRPAPVAAFNAAPPPVVADLRPSERGQGRTVATGSAAPAKRSGGLLSSMGLLIAVLIAGTCGYVGWYKLSHPPVPAELKPWLEQGQGVTYAPQGAGLSVSLPGTPAEHGATVTIGRGTLLAARVAESTVGDHIVGVAWLSAPPSSLTDDAEGPTHAAAVMASQAVGFSLDVPQSASYHGLGAISAEISRSGLDGDGFVILDGTRIIVVYVLGTTHGTAGFDHLRHSLQLS